MANHPNRTPAYYVAFGNRFSYVRGRESAYQRLAEYLGTTAEEVAANRRRIAGIIKPVSATEARAAGV
jgi:hypothetical protein